MAGESELTVAFSVDPPGCSAGTMRLPQVTRRLTRDEVMLARGTADAFALRLRYHDDATHRRYAPEGETATRALRGDGDRALRGDGRAGDARHRRQHRRQDRRRGAARSAMPRSPIRPRAAGAGRRLSGAAARHRPRRCRPGRRTCSDLWRGHLDSHAGGTFAGLDARARRPAGLRPLRAPGDRGSRLRRPARRGSGRRRRRRRGRGGGRGEPRASRSPAATPRTTASEEAASDDTADRRAHRPPGAAGGARHRRRRRCRRGDGRRRERAARDAAAAALFRGRSRLQGLHDEVRRGDRRRGSRRPGRARPAAGLSRPAARAAEGRGGAARQPAAAPAAGAAEPGLGVRPRGRHARRRPAGAGRSPTR